jgi:hypothetical protein
MWRSPEGTMGKCKALETALNNKLLSSHEHLKKVFSLPPPNHAPLSPNHAPLSSSVSPLFILLLPGGRGRGAGERVRLPLARPRVRGCACGGERHTAGVHRPGNATRPPPPLPPPRRNPCCRPTRRRGGGRSPTRWPTDWPSPVGHRSTVAGWGTGAPAFVWLVRARLGVHRGKRFARHCWALLSMPAPGISPYLKLWRQFET